jgi:hypothetical protein
MLINRYDNFNTIVSLNQWSQICLLYLGKILDVPTGQTNENYGTLLREQSKRYVCGNIYAQLDVLSHVKIRYCFPCKTPITWPMVLSEISVFKPQLHDCLEL